MTWIGFVYERHANLSYRWQWLGYPSGDYLSTTRIAVALRNNQLFYCTSPFVHLHTCAMCTFGLGILETEDSQLSLARARSNHCPATVFKSKSWNETTMCCRSMWHLSAIYPEPKSNPTMPLEIGLNPPQEIASTFAKDWKFWANPAMPRDARDVPLLPLLSQLLPTPRTHHTTVCRPGTAPCQIHPELVSPWHRVADTKIGKNWNFVDLSLVCVLFLGLLETVFCGTEWTP